MAELSAIFFNHSSWVKSVNKNVSMLTGILLATICWLGVVRAESQPEHTFEIGAQDFLLDGKPLQIRCGELHFARVPREYWRHRLQMCKAMGFNTVCAYLFWNFHERQPGEFTWEGQADAAEFCRLAQDEGLWVVLRPGPYVCAEWTMGGLPWWLLKHEDIQLRSRDPRFIKAARAYLKEVGRVLGPLQVTRGGPILMVQAENEYGFYDKDPEYMGEIRQALLEAGFDTPLFDCNPVHTLKRGYREDLFSVVNFGSNPKGAFDALRKIQPQGPLMCGEYYSGWFDTWGKPHHTGNTSRFLGDLDYMLKEGASFSVYMVHGGTSFGIWSGADRPFKPDTSCYDYDAPISEAGWVTQKFRQTRKTMSKHLKPEELPLPDPPPAYPVVSIEPFSLKRRAPLYDNLPEPVLVEEPGTFEDHNLVAGSILYRTTLPAGPACRLTAKAVHDMAWVSIDGEQVGVLDRRKNLKHLSLPARSTPSQLDIFVDAMGRVNFGREVHDRKGLHGPVDLRVAGDSPRVLKDWRMYLFPMDDSVPKEFQFESGESVPGPAFYEGEFTIDQPGDTFLDVSSWGKGIVWVNDHCLGRFWNIGPTQTMYLPGVWLNSGSNRVIVYDVIGPSETELCGVKEPVMDRLRPELDVAGARRKNRPLALQNRTPIHTGVFEKGDKAQTVKFSQPVEGRYFCLQSVNAFGGHPFAAAAEIDLIDPNGVLISHSGWTIAHVSSEEQAAEDGSAENAIDGQTANHWHTAWSSDPKPSHPHYLAIDLGQSRSIHGMRYVPRNGQNDEIGGRIKKYRIYIGNDIVAEPRVGTEDGDPMSQVWPGKVWRDESGKPIDAHGGGILFHNGTYYWYGEMKQGKTYLPKVNASWGGYRVDLTGVSCYSSKDLVSWKFEGNALPAVESDASHDLHPSKVLERPKVIHNAATDKFVMWLHIDSMDYADARSGVAVSDSPTGPFEYQGSFRPNAGIEPVVDLGETSEAFQRDFQGGQMARDQTLFVDDDGAAYHFYSSEDNATMHVSRLTEDYLRPAGEYRRLFVGRMMEAPAVFKRQGKYYLIASGCTGWKPNEARSAVADSIWGPWRELGNPCRGAGSKETFRSQSTFVLPAVGQSDRFIFMADRWNERNLTDSRYVWLPIMFDQENRPTITWRDNWKP